MTPDDVYVLVDARTNRTYSMLLALLWVGIALAGVIVVQIIAKIIIWRKVICLLRETKTLNYEAMLLVRAAESHGKLNDQNNARSESILAQTKEVVSTIVPPQAERILTEVRQVPKKVVEELHGDSGYHQRIP